MEGQSIKYDRRQIVLHWFSAIIILWALVSGISIGMLPLSESVIKCIAELNVSITFLFIPFFIYRIYLRKKLPLPEYHHLSGRHALLARSTQVILYFLVSVVLISGVLMLDKSYTVFSLLEIHPVSSDAIQIEAFKSLHAVASYLLGIALFAHIFAALMHLRSNTEVFDRVLISGSK